MKKFILKVLLFFACICIVDVVFGIVMQYMIVNTKGGDNGRNNFICDKVDTDILIVGSSRAMHHYNPQIIEDSLGLTCYNIGQEGNGFIFNYARLQMIFQRYHPKLIIYDVYPAYDILEGEDNHRYLKLLKAYYEREGISEVFESIDQTEKYKMKSQMYRYNSYCFVVVLDFIHPLKSSANGFRPISLEMNILKTTPPHTQKKSAKKVEYDELKLSYMNKLIDTLDSTKIIFSISPYWYGAMDSIEIRPVLELCKQRQIPFIDFSGNSKYVQQNKFFCDGSHLNAKGADEYTKDLIKFLKSDSVIYEKMIKSVNPYGDGKACGRIVEALK